MKFGIAYVLTMVAMLYGMYTFYQYQEVDRYWYEALAKDVKDQPELYKEKAIVWLEDGVYRAYERDEYWEINRSERVRTHGTDEERIKSAVESIVD